MDCGETDDEPPFQLASDQSSVSENVEFADRVEAIREVFITRCTSRQRLVLHCLFPELGLTAAHFGVVRNSGGEALEVDSIRLWKGKTTFSTIGSFLGLTRERVRQLYHGAILKIRTILLARELVRTSERRRTTPNSNERRPAGCHYSATERRSTDVSL